EGRCLCGVCVGCLGRHCLDDRLCLFFFFFQAEDGIRDFHVTGVQTCALPISIGMLCPGMGFGVPSLLYLPSRGPSTIAPASPVKIGRASCRERVSNSVVGVALEKKDS